MKLFTIGDSISQGFMSGAAARTDLCYSTLIARALGLAPDQYRYPDWPSGGHPVDIERVLRRLNRLYGHDIKGPLEWPMALLRVASLLDETEDYYERGPRAAHRPLADGARYFHNIAVRGFDVADAHLVNGALCRQQIALEPQDDGDGFFATPGASFYRTALDVLNPSKDPKLDGHSALTWLAAHCQDKHEKSGGVENLLVWLGANNALGTILGMEIKETPADPKQMPNTQPAREHFSLWHPDVFADEYGTLLDGVDAAMQKNRAEGWRVFVGNVPAVSIAPLAKGVGPEIIKADPFGVLPQAKYYKYYTYFLFDEDAAHRSHAPKLTVDDIYRIDGYIQRYNEAIKAKLDALNQQHGQTRYVLVDICRVLLTAAYKRNDGNPTYPLPAPVAALNPVPTTKYYHANRQARVEAGGLFSLDGVHPGAIGQGIIAHEFLAAMKAAGVTGLRSLDWPAIIANDSLWTQPISLMREVYQHDKLLDLVLRLVRKTSRLTQKLNPP